MQHEIAVSETPSQVNTEAGGNFDANTADRQMLNNLPSLDQDYVGMMSRFLSAGATGTGGVTLIVDGMEVTKAGVSASAIQEGKINNNPYSAEYSRPGRGRVEILTQPGSATRSTCCSADTTRLQRARVGRNASSCRTPSVAAARRPTLCEPKSTGSSMRT